MSCRTGVRVHKPFAAKCEVRANGKFEDQTLAYRAHSAAAVRKKALLKMSVVRVCEITEITEAEYDRFMKSKRFPDGLPPSLPHVADQSPAARSI